MNKYQEALENIIVYPLKEDCENSPCCQCENQCDFYKMKLHDYYVLKELVDKATPMKPFKFEDLHDFMAYHDKILDKDCLIAQVRDKENISICWYVEHGILVEDWIEFEENRFFPVQYANEVQL